MGEWLDSDAVRLIVSDIGLTSELGLPVHHHPAASADAHPAGPPETERRVDLVLDMIECVENNPVVFVGKLVLLKARAGLAVGQISKDLQDRSLSHARTPALQVAI